MDFLARVTHRLLTGDDTQVSDSAVKKLVVASGTTYTHVDDDLLKTRNVVNVGEPELLEAGRVLRLHTSP